MRSHGLDCQECALVLFERVHARHRSERAPPGRSVFLSAHASYGTMPRPVAAGVLTIVGGFFIILGGLVFALLGAFFALLGFVSGVFLLGLLVGFLTIIVGLLMVAVPSGHTVWGTLAVLLALVSIPVAFGGLFVGFVLTLIGGLLALRWKRPVDRVITVEGRVVPPPSS